MRNLPIAILLVIAGYGFTTLPANPDDPHATPLTATFRFEANADGKGCVATATYNGYEYYCDEPICKESLECLKEALWADGWEGIEPVELQ